MLRGLAAEEVFDELDDGRFALGPLGEALRPLQGAAIARGEVYYDSAAGLFEAVMRGGVPYEHTHGERFFDHLGQHPSREAAFQASMAGRAELEAEPSSPRTTSRGSRQSSTSAAVGACSLPRSSRAHPASAARFSIAPPRSPTHACTSSEAGLADRAECVAGDFFTELPNGADAYVLSRVLHDWHDADATRILETCRRAMRPDSSGA